MLNRKIFSTPDPNYPPLVPCIRVKPTLKTGINGTCLQLILFVCCILFLSCLPAKSHGQSITLCSQAYYPQVFFAVSKKQQRLFILQSKSPLRPIKSYPCSTGDKTGDKQIQGDMRTPEGIYFLERRLEIDQRPDLYGHLAYTLNYPNPIDRLRGKTGYGIWLHGRGKPLLPRDTKGCVAMQTQSLRSLQPLIDLNQTPLIIAEDIQISRDKDQLSPEIYKMILSWVRAWRGKKQTFFSFYDPQRFSKANGQSFTSFTRHKKELFARYPWIDVFIDGLHIVRAPSYWVAYFKQLYRSPSFYSQGIKRLYWQMLAGLPKIVGQEFIERPDLDLEPIYLQAREKEITKWLNQWRSAWQDANLKAYLSCYHPRARQNKIQGRDRIGKEKRRLWAKDRPQKIRFGPLDIRAVRQGFRVRFEQDYQGLRGYHDRGKKTLLIRPQSNHPGSYLILREKWSRS